MSIYNDVYDLVYDETLKRFQTSVKFLTKSFEKNNRGDPYQYVDNMLYWSASNGNLPVTKYLIEEKNADPNARRNGQTPVLVGCILNQKGTDESSFRDVAIYLMDNGAIPNIDENEPLKAAYNASIAMFAGKSSFGNSPPKDEHDKVVKRLLSEKSVIETIIEKKQEEFYQYIPEIVDVFLF